MEPVTVIPAAGPEWVRKKIPVWATIGEAIGFATKNFPLLFLIAISGTAIQAVTGLIPSKEYPLLAFITFPLSLAGIFMSLWADVAIITALSRIYNKQGTNFKESFGISAVKIWPFLLNSILMAFVVVFSTLFFIVPGIYFSVIYSLVTIAVIVEDHRTISPFKMSAALVKKYFWTVVLYGLAVLVMLLPIIIICAGPFFYFAVKSPESMRTLATNPLVPAATLVMYLIQSLLMPYFQSISYMLYEKLKDAKRGSKELSDPELLKPRMNGCVMAIVFIVLTLALAVVLYLIFKGYLPHK
jgi:hypothetical protein